MPVHRPDRERGIALVTVLWALAFLSILALSLVVAGRGETRIGRNLADGARARALADAGVYRAVSALTDLDRNQRWRGDGRVYSFKLGEGEVRIAVQDEAGKVDINAASNALLQALALSAGVTPDQAQAIADAIEDWRDTDDLRRANGAESEDYRTAGKSYGPTNRRFENVEELQLVLGVTQPVYERLAERVTVYSGQPGIDPMSAPPQVLGILPGLDEASVARLISLRENATTPASITSVLSSPFFGAAPGAVVTVHAEGHSPGGAVYARDAVVRLTNDIQTPYLVIRWKRGARRLFEE